ncbi:MAG: hypothetical protein WD404_01085 [Solirubrobacterales bacterium]
MKRLAPACVLVAALVLPAAAPAKINVLKGTVHAEGVPGTGTVRVHVKVGNNGKPRKVTRVIYRNLDARCNVGDFENPVYEPAGELSGNAGRNQGTGIEFDRSFRWVSYPQSPPRSVNVLGRLNRKGTRISGGKIEVGNNLPGACQLAKGTFTATRK